MTRAVRAGLSSEKRTGSSAPLPDEEQALSDALKRLYWTLERALQKDHRALLLG